MGAQPGKAATVELENGALRASHKAGDGRLLCEQGQVATRTAVDALHIGIIANRMMKAMLRDTSDRLGVHDTHLRGNFVP